MINQLNSLLQTKGVNPYLVDDTNSKWYKVSDIDTTLHIKFTDVFEIAKDEFRTDVTNNGAYAIVKDSGVLKCIMEIKNPIINYFRNTLSNFMSSSIYTTEYNKVEAEEVKYGWLFRK